MDWTASTKPAGRSAGKPQASGWGSAGKNTTKSTPRTGWDRFETTSSIEAKAALNQIQALMREGKLDEAEKVFNGSAHLFNDTARSEISKSIHSEKLTRKVSSYYNLHGVGDTLKYIQDSAQISDNELRQAGLTREDLTALIIMQNRRELGTIKDAIDYLENNRADLEKKGVKVNKLILNLKKDQILSEEVEYKGLRGIAGAIQFVKDNKEEFSKQGLNAGAIIAELAIDLMAQTEGKQTAIDHLNDPNYTKDRPDFKGLTQELRQAKIAELKLKIKKAEEGTNAQKLRELIDSQREYAQRGLRVKAQIISYQLENLQMFGDEDDINNFIDGKVSQKSVTDIFGTEDKSWQEFFTNPEEKNLTFKDNVEAAIKAKIKDPDKQARLLALLKQTQDVNPAKMAEAGINVAALRWRIKVGQWSKTMDADALQAEINKPDNRKAMEDCGVDVAALLRKISIDKYLAKGDVSGAVKFVIDNRKDFGGISNNTAVNNEVLRLVNDKKIQEALSRIETAWTKKELTDQADYEGIKGFVQLLGKLYGIQFIVRISNVPSGWKPYSDPAPEIKNDDLKPVYEKSKGYDHNGGKDPDQAAVTRLQRLLSGVKNARDARFTYLPASGYTPGKMDINTVIALINFKGRFEVAADASQQTGQMVKDKDKSKNTSEMYFSWSTEDIDELEKEYNKNLEEKPVHEALIPTKLARAVIARGIGTGTTDFIFYMLAYLKETDPANIEVYNRLQSVLIEGADAKQLKEEDLETFRRAADKEVNAAKLAAAMKTRPSMSGNKFLKVSVNTVNGAIQVKGNDRTEIIYDQPSAARIYSNDVDLYIKAPLLFWKRNFVLAQGGTLPSGLTTDYLTGDDLIRIAEFKSARNKPSIHYPLSFDKALISKIETNKNKSPVLRALYDKISQSLPREVINKKLTGADARMTQILNFILSKPGEEHSTLMALLEPGAKVGDLTLTEEDKKFLKDIKNEYVNKTINIDIEEYRALASILSPDEMTMLGIRPDNTTSYSDAAIADLKALGGVYKNRRINISELANIAQDKSPGAAAILLDIQTMRSAGLVSGAQDNSDFLSRINPRQLDPGLSSAPTLSKLRVLKLEYYRTQKPEILAKIQSTQTEIKGLEAEIAKYRGRDLNRDERKKLDELMSTKAVKLAQLQEYLSLIDGEGIPAGFFNWVIANKVKGFSSSAVGLANRHLFGVYYSDVIDRSPLTLTDLQTLLEKEQGFFDELDKKYPGFGWNQWGLFSLDLSADAERMAMLTPEERNRVLRIKQAFSAFVNVAIRPDGAVSSRINLTSLGDGARGILGIDSWREATARKQQLKMLAANYYAVVLKDKDPVAYANIITGVWASSDYTKYDLDVFKKLLENQRSEAAKKLADEIDTILKNPANFGDKGALKSGVGGDVFDRLFEFFYKTGAIDNQIMASDSNNVSGAKEDSALNKVFPFLDPKWVAAARRNFPMNGHDSIILAILDEAYKKNLPKEAFVAFVMQQIMMRVIMPYRIYAGLPVTIAADLYHGHYKQAGTDLAALVAWPRFSPMWYFAAFDELVSGNPITALVMYYATNYLTMRGGWGSVWGRTLTPDAEMLRIASKLPGIERLTSKGITRAAAAREYKGAVRAGVEWATRTDVAQRVFERWEAFSLTHRRASTAIKIAGHALWGVGVDPFRYVIDMPMEKIMEMDRDTGRTSRRFAVRGAQRFILGYNYALDHFPLLLDSAIKLGVEGAGSLRVKSRVRNALKGLNAPVDGANVNFGKEFVDNGGSLNFEGGDTRAAIKITAEGSYAPSGQGAFEVNFRLFGFLRANGLKNSGVVDANGMMDVTVLPPDQARETHKMRVAEVRVVKGDVKPYVEIRRHSDLMSYDACDVILYISENDLNNPDKLNQSLASLKKATVEQGISVNRIENPSTLTGTSFNESDQKKASDKVTRTQGPAAEDAVIDGRKIDINDPNFWKKYSEAVEKYKNGQMEEKDFVAWEIAANRKAYITAGEGDVVLYKSQALSVLLSSEPEKSNLFQLDPGLGKTLPIIYGAAQRALMGDKVFILVTNDDLIDQYKRDPAFEVLERTLGKRAVGVIRDRDSGSPDSARRNTRIVSDSKVVFVTWQQMAHLISTGDVPRKAFKTGLGDNGRLVCFGDESDLKMVSEAMTAYVSSAEKGSRGNPILDYATYRRTKAKWEKAYKAFEAIKNNAAHFDKNTGTITKDGWDYIGRELKINTIDAFTANQFDQFLIAEQLRYENSVVERTGKTGRQIKEESRQRGETVIIYSEQYHYEIDGRRIYLVTEGIRQENMVFGGGLDEALRMVYGFDLKAEHMTVSSTGVNQLLGFFDNVNLFSGTNLENYEIINELYGSLNLRMFDLEPPLSRVEITSADLNNEATYKAIADRLIEQMKADARRGVGYTRTDTVRSGKSDKQVKIRGKIMFQGVSQNDPRVVEFNRYLQIQLRLNGLDISVSTVFREPWSLAQDKPAAQKIAADRAYEVAKQGRGVLIQVNTYEEATALYELLRSRHYTDVKVNILTGANSTGEMETAVREAGKPNVITISTRMSRGTNTKAADATLVDIALDRIASNEVWTHGGIVTRGMHVIDINPDNLATNKQRLDRAPRMYRPGSGETIITRDSAILQNLQEEQRQRLFSLDGSHIDQYSSGDEAWKIIKNAYDIGYNKAYQSADRQFMQSNLQEGPMTEFTEYYDEIREGNSFVKKVIDRSIDGLFAELEIDPESGLTDAQVTRLESRIGALMGGRKVDLSGLKGAKNIELVKKMVADGIFKQFSESYMGRAFIRDGIGAEVEGENIRELQMKLNERRASYLEAMEAAYHENIINGSGTKEERASRLAKRVNDARTSLMRGMCEDVFEWSFPIGTRGLYNDAMNATAADRVSLKITKADAIKNGQALEAERAVYGRPGSVPAGRHTAQRAGDKPAEPKPEPKPEDVSSAPRRPRAAGLATNRPALEINDITLNDGDRETLESEAGREGRTGIFTTDIYGNKILIIQKGEVRIVYDFGKKGERGSLDAYDVEGQMVIEDGVFNIAKIKADPRFNYSSINGRSEVREVRINGKTLRIWVYTKSGDAYQCSARGVRYMAGGLGMVAGPRDRADVMAHDNSVSRPSTIISDVPKPTRVDISRYFSPLTLSLSNGLEMPATEVGLSPVEIRLLSPSFGIRPMGLDLGPHVDSRLALSRLSSRGVAFVEFDDMTSLDKDAFEKILNSKEFARQLKDKPGRKLVIFTTEHGYVDSVKAVVISIPDGAVVERVTPEGEREYFKIIDEKSKVPIAFIEMHNGTPKFEGAFNMAAVAHLRGLEVAQKVAEQRIQYVRRNYFTGRSSESGNTMLTVLEALKKVDPALAERVNQFLLFASDEQLNIVKPEHIEALTARISRPEYRTKLEPRAEMEIINDLVRVGISFEQAGQHIEKMRWARIENEPGMKKIAQELRSINDFDIRKVPDMEKFIADLKRIEGPVEHTLVALGLVEARPAVKLRLEVPAENLGSIDDSFNAKGVNDSDWVSVRSKEEFRINAGRETLESVINANNMMESKLREAGLMNADGTCSDNMAALELRLVIEKLPLSKGRSFEVETIAGRKAVVSFVNGEVIITLSAVPGDANSREMQVRLTKAEYDTLVKGEKAYKSLVDAAKSQNRGISLADIRQKLQSYNLIKKLRAALLTGKPVVVPFAELEGTRRDIELKLEIRRTLSFDLGTGRPENIDFNSRDIDALSTSVKGTEKYNKALENVRAVVRRAGKADKMDAITTKIEHDAKQARIIGGATGFFAPLAETEALRYRAEKEAEIERMVNEGKISAVEGQKRMGEAIAQARKIYVVFMKKAHERLRNYCKDHDIATLNEDQVRNELNKMGKEAGIEVGSVKEADLGSNSSEVMRALQDAGFIDRNTGLLTSEFDGNRAKFDQKLSGLRPDARENAFRVLNDARERTSRIDEEVASISREFTMNPDGQGVRAWLDYMALNAPGGSTGRKFMSIGVNTGKTAIIGMIVETIPAIIRNKGINRKTIDEILSSGLSWGTFDALSRADQIFGKMKAGEANIAAITLITLYSVCKADPNQRGVALANGAMSLSGFMAFSYIAELGFSLIPGGKVESKVLRAAGEFGHEVAVAAFGISGSFTFETGFMALMDDCKPFRDFVTSPQFNALGTVAKEMAPAIGILQASRITSGLLLRFGLEATSTLVRRITPPLLLLDVIGIQSDVDMEAKSFGSARSVKNKANSRKDFQTADLASFALDRQLYYIKPNTYGESHIGRPFQVIDGSFPFYPTDQLMFEVAVLLKSQGYFVGKPSAGNDELMTALDKAYRAYKSGDNNAYMAAFKEYHDILKSGSSQFEADLRSAMASFAGVARKRGYSHTEVWMSDTARNKLGGNYKNFLIREEKNRYQRFMEAQRKHIRDSINQPKTGAAWMLKQTLRMVEAFKEKLLSDIKAQFGVTNPQTAEQIRNIILANNIDIDTATARICQMLGKTVAKGSEEWDAISRFVVNNRFKYSSCKSESAVQKAYFREKIKTPDYVEFIKRRIHAEDRKAFEARKAMNPEQSHYYVERNIAAGELEPYLTGNKFEETYADYLLEQQQMQFTEENMRRALSSNSKDAFSKVMKARFNELIALQPAEYNRNPEGFKNNFITTITKQWFDNSGEIATEMDAKLGEHNGQISLLSIPSDARGGFISYLEGLQAEEGGILHGAVDSPAGAFTPEIAAYLLGLSR